MANNEVFNEIILKKLDALDNDVKKINDNVHEVRIVQASQAKDLETHIKRTEQNEESLKLLRLELTPARKIADFLKTSLQLVGIISLIGGAVLTVIKVIS